MDENFMSDKSNSSSKNDELIKLKRDITTNADKGHEFQEIGPKRQFRVSNSVMPPAPKDPKDQGKK